ncbi:MAG: sugar phosphate nucleotidyltransferase [archaeon]
MVGESFAISRENVHVRFTNWDDRYHVVSTGEVEQGGTMTLYIRGRIRDRHCLAAISETEGGWPLLLREGDWVTGIVEKPDDPPSDLVNTGANALPGRAIDHLDVPASERGERELTDVLRRMIDRNGIAAVRFDRWADVGYPWDLLETTERYLDRMTRDIAGEVYDDDTLNETVVVESGASIDPGVVIDGPVIVRRNATIGPNATGRGRTVVGERARICHAAYIENSVLMEAVTVNHLSFVGDSPLGRAATLGAGTAAANRATTMARCSQALIHNDRTPTIRCGRRPKSKIGVLTSLNPGVVLQTGTQTAPGVVMTGGPESAQRSDD